MMKKPVTHHLPYSQRTKKKEEMVLELEDSSELRGEHFDLGLLKLDRFKGRL